LPAYKPLGSINARKLVRRTAGNAIRRIGEFMPQNLGDVIGGVLDPTGGARLATSIGGSLGRGDIRGAANQLGGLVQGAADPFLNLATAPLAALPESTTLGQVGREGLARGQQHGFVDEALALGGLVAPKFMKPGPRAALSEAPAAVNPVERSVIANEVARGRRPFEPPRQLTQAEWAQHDPLGAALASGKGLKEVTFGTEDLIGAAKKRNAALREAAGEKPRPRTPAEPQASLAPAESKPGISEQAARENARVAAERQAAHAKYPEIKAMADELGLTMDPPWEHPTGKKGPAFQFSESPDNRVVSKEGHPATIAFGFGEEVTPEKLMAEVMRAREQFGPEALQTPLGKQASKGPTTLKGAQARVAEQMDKIYRKNLKAQGITPPPESTLPADILDLLRPKE